MSTTEPGPGGQEPAVRPGDQSDQLSDEEEIRAAKQADRFDISRIIGGVFTVYGLLLTLMGIFGSHHIKTKAAGINIDLWTGIGMLVFAGLMLFWALSRPVSRDRPEVGGQGSGQLGGEPAT